MADGPSRRALADAQKGEEGTIPPTIEDIFSTLTDVTADTRDEYTHDEVQDIKQILREAHERGLIDSGVRSLDRRDAAEVFVGSVIFASPLLVEDGIFDIAEYLFEFTVFRVPVFLIANTLFVVFMTYALVEWTGRERRETDALRSYPGSCLHDADRLVHRRNTPDDGVGTRRCVGVADRGDCPYQRYLDGRVLGAGLGDILGDSDPVPVTAHGGPPQDGTRGVESRPNDAASEEERLETVRNMTDSALLEALHEEFTDLSSIVADSVDRTEVKRLRESTFEATLDTGFDDRIQKYTSRDIAEAFVGSIFFSIPFLVEDGVFDIADFFLSVRIGPLPVYLLVNAVFVLLMILLLVYWAGPQDVEMSRPIFGFIPRRLVGTAIVAFLTAAALMTMWGRVDNWRDPAVALARISVVWTVASFGAALGDILPGESSGDDINDDLAKLGDVSRNQDDTAEDTE
ncbi:MAG: hypothetical protein ACOCR6_02940 [archaeon]